LGVLKRTRAVLLVIALVASAGSLAGLGVVALVGATTPGAVYSACVSQGDSRHHSFSSLDHSGGTLYDVTVNGTPQCRRGDTSITWNQTGPQGPAGPRGLQGPPGPSGALLASESAFATAPYQIITDVGPPIAFDTAEAGFGTDITQTSSTVFTLNAAGVYRVTFNVTMSEVSSEVTFAVIANGVAVQPSATVSTNVVPPATPPEAAVSGSVTINGTSGETISVGITFGGALVISGSSMSVDQLTE
jgi:hypothetical protein